MKTSMATVTAAAVLLLAVLGAEAFPKYNGEIPNAPPGVAAVGHVRTSGGGGRNAFGQDFEKAGNKWTVALCKADSDGDGFTNGQELGDPNCKWKKGDVSPKAVGRTLSHPGVASSVPQAL